MRIFLLIDHELEMKYAEFSHRGTWADDRACPKCGLPLSYLTEPLLVEWEPGCSTVGELAWCSYHFIVVERVRDFLVDQLFECTFGETKMVPPDPPRKRSIVPWPYDGPMFHWVLCNQILRLNEAASGVALKINCYHCGQKRYNFKMDGIVVDRTAWNDQKMFRIEQFGRSNAKFITEQALEQILSQEFRNFHYREAGVIE